MTKNEPINARGIVITMEQVARFAPVIYFHPQEKYWPCRIEDILNKATLKDRNHQVIVPRPTQDHLKEHYNDGSYLDIDPAIFTGVPPTDGQINVPIYVAVQVPESKSYIDLRFIFLSAYNGPQTARVLVWCNDFNCQLETYAEHQGDIEGMTVRVDPDFQKIQQVIYEAHGEPRVYRTEEVDFEGDTHPIARCAYNSHATYNGKEKKDDDWITLESYSLLGWGADFIDIIHCQGPVWRPFAYDSSGRTILNDKLIFVGLKIDGEPINGENWAKFEGTIGAVQTNDFKKANGIGEPLRRRQENYVNSLVGVAKILGLIPEKYKIGHPTGGLGGRDYIHLPPEE
ncbi:MAG TPA: Vps62-related protein [Bacillota bacterium]|nr:Vps62-related protein [Bacillota bacterium]